MSVASRSASPTTEPELASGVSRDGSGRSTGSPAALLAGTAWTVGTETGTAHRKVPVASSPVRAVPGAAGAGTVRDHGTDLCGVTALSAAANA
ncbi:MAG TPA: hypothetical protein VEB59_08090 [Gemmatimonadales bacterium]|nr:hypothetical protein [Gemmatimonadales bacterium]